MEKERLLIYVLSDATKMVHDMALDFAKNPIDDIKCPQEWYIRLRNIDERILRFVTEFRERTEDLLEKK